MARNKRSLGFLLVGAILASTVAIILADVGPKDNGDIYVKNEGHESSEEKSDGIDLDEVVSICNASFSIPMDNLVEFNNTGELPNVVDKTGPCFIRCFYEKSAFIKDFKLDSDKIRQYMWPATGDSIEVCQDEGKNETNACVRTYAIAKCLMIRALVDARNKPMK